MLAPPLKAPDLMPETDRKQLQDAVVALFQGDPRNALKALKFWPKLMSTGRNLGENASSARISKGKSQLAAQERRIRGRASPRRSLWKPGCRCAKWNHRETHEKCSKTMENPCEDSKKQWKTRWEEHEKHDLKGLERPKHHLRNPIPSYIRGARTFGSPS